MTRSWRLTLHAEAALIDIAYWTIETFGARQADIYETQLIARCEAIAAREIPGQDCAILAEGLRPGEMCFARAGQHFVVYLDQPDEVVILDFLHGRVDLPRHLAALSGQGR